MSEFFTGPLAVRVVILDLDGTDFEILHRFTGTNGQYPYGRLIPLDQTLAGMTWANGVLFVCANGLINTLELSPPRITAVYRVPGWDVVGIAFDGTFFWVSLDGESGVEIARISL